MPAPASWENATPIYGIRYPKPTAPAMYLPDAFAHIGADLEQALRTADIPAVTPAPVMVAPSAAARDAYWGVPATADDQLALQNRGATTIRTDLGTTQRYYATATRPTAGWWSEPTAAAARDRAMSVTNSFSNPTVAQDFPVAADKAALDLPFVKASAASLLRVNITIPLVFSSGATQVMTAVINIDGTDYPVGTQIFPTAPFYGTITGTRDIPGIAAGSRPIKPRVQTQAGATVAVNSTTRVSFQVQEVWAPNA